jgi:hypothetical protein
MTCRWWRTSEMRLSFPDLLQNKFSGRSTLLLNCPGLLLAEDAQHLCIDRIYGIASERAAALSTITIRVNLRDEKSDF